MASIVEDSSESDSETEPAKCFHKKLSTNRQMATAKCIKEGYLLKQGNSLQKWKRRYFKLKSKKLFYSKDSKFQIFNEIELINTTVAECSLKSVNKSFQVITPSRHLVLSAESRKEMEDWISAIRATATNEFYNPSLEQCCLDSDHHSWCALSNVRTFCCGVCGESLSGLKRPGVALGGLSCEVCKFKSHKHCASQATTGCKWMTLASIGDDIVKEEDGTILMPHQWMFGNLPVNSKCGVCEKTCGSIRRLKDWSCLWCHSTVHSSCRDGFTRECSLGRLRISILPPPIITGLDSDGFWRATKTFGLSPLLVLINSKSGNNQGVKMLRRFKQLLNPAQVFDLMSGGLQTGLRLFQSFKSFRVLVCGGDGSISWVLSEIDKLGLHAQVGVLPLGTGNDLARVLGWGTTFDDDSQLWNVLEQLECAQIKMLDRWSINCYQRPARGQNRLSLLFDPIALNNSIASYLSQIQLSESDDTVNSSAIFLCSNVRELVNKVSGIKSEGAGDDTAIDLCSALNERLVAILKIIGKESICTSNLTSSSTEKPEEAAAFDSSDRQPTELSKPGDGLALQSKTFGEATTRLSQKSDCQKPTTFQPIDQLMSRIDSFKETLRQIIEYAEKVVDGQNVQLLESEPDEVFQNSAVDSPPDPNRTPPECPDPKLNENFAGDDPSCKSSTSSPEIDLNHLSAISESDPGLADNSHSYSSDPVFHSLPDSESGASVLQSLMTSDLPYPVDNVSAMFKRRAFAGTLYRSSQIDTKSVGSRHVSSLIKFKRTGSLTTLVCDRTPAKDTVCFPILNVPLLQTLPNSLSCGSKAGDGKGFISKKLLESADTVCAAVSPFTESEAVFLKDFEEKCVMNNYFGIGLDAKISLEFHNKREEHPEKCRSRTKNRMWYGVLGGREIYQRTFKNLEQKVRLECDGHLIQLPNLQGIVVLNIQSYMGGTNFWGGTRGTEGFISPAFDDHILEVVAVFGSIQLGISRVFNLQKHRIAQCRSVKITILGSEGIPVQADGEAWIQPPGLIYISHKGRAQMLSKDKVFAETLRTWTEKQKTEQKPSGRKHYILSDEEFLVLQSFVDAAKALVSSVKTTSLDQHEGSLDLDPLMSQVSRSLDHFNLKEEHNKPLKRSLVSDLVNGVRALFDEVRLLTSEKSCVSLTEDAAADVEAAMSLVEVVMENVCDIDGLPHFQTAKDEPLTQDQSRRKDTNAFQLKLTTTGKVKAEELQHTNPLLWSVEDVCHWLHCLDLDEYQGVFVSRDIQGRELISLSLGDLKDLGVSEVGHSQRILEAINDLRKCKDQATSSLSSSSSSSSSQCRGNQSTN